MNPLRISLFHTLSIQYGDENPLNLASRRAQELLCYLLLYRDQLHAREKLATLLWADKPAAQAKRYLRQILWQVQAALKPSAQPEQQLLLVDYERMGTNPQTNYWLDVVVLEQTFIQVGQTPGRALGAAQVALLHKAVQLYQGDLLEGWYCDWCIYERERYQRMYLALLDKLLAHSEAHQAYEAGLTYATQILRYDREREQTHRQLMRLHSLAGNRTAAIHQYASCVSALRDELDVEPAKSTIALYHNHKICAEQIPVPALFFEESASQPALPQPAKLDPLRQLEGVQATLTHLQTQVTQLIHSLNQPMPRQTEN